MATQLDNVTPELEQVWRTDPLSSNVSIHSYSHSPVHVAVLTEDYAALNSILGTLSKPAPAGSIHTEEQSVKAEEEAEAASAVIDRRDVPGKESPLHLAVRMKDSVAVELLVLAGADISLQNIGGWTAMQEAVCAGEPALVAIIMREYQNLAWAKWLRRLPRLVATMKRMRDFYMELTWNFESSVIPFIGKIAPSDTYRIWKRGACLRADMTLEGFDGFRIKRADQSIIFLGEGTPDGKVKPGGVIVLMHKEREIWQALEGMGRPVSDAAIAADVADLFRTNVHRAGLDVTRATLNPVKTWRRHEKEEAVGPWQSKVVDMHHVTVSFRSRKVPGAMSDEELFNRPQEDEDTSSAPGDDDDFADVLTEEERRQLKEAMENTAGADSDAHSEVGVSDAADDGSEGPLTPEGTRAGIPGEDTEGSVKFGGSGGTRQGLTPNEKKGSSGGPVGGVGSQPTAALEGEGLLSGDHSAGVAGKKSARKGWFGWGKKHSTSSEMPASNSDLTVTNRSGADSVQSPVSSKSKREGKSSGANGEGAEKNGSMEFSKGLKPTLWLTSEFPLRTEELLPLLDLLSPRVKAVRRLRELLTVKLPRGTFPVKVAIPIIPTIRVVVTVSKFREIARLPLPGTPEDEEDQFEDAQSEMPRRGWMEWARGAPGAEVLVNGQTTTEGSGTEDAFAIPGDYRWVDNEEKNRRAREKRLERLTKGKTGTKAAASSEPKA